MKLNVYDIINAIKGGESIINIFRRRTNTSKADLEEMARIVYVQGGRFLTSDDNKALREHCAEAKPEQVKELWCRAMRVTPKAEVK